MNQAEEKSWVVTASFDEKQDSKKEKMRMEHDD